MNQVLAWMNISHIPAAWNIEMSNLCKMTKGKSYRKSLLKMAFTETMYAVWTSRNKIIFQQVKILLSQSLVDLLSGVWTLKSTLYRFPF